MTSKKNDNPKISVIVPCYNTEKYVPRCLKSIMEQTYKNLEIICVNDHSGDRMEIILNEYAEADSRIKVVNNPKNLGLFHSRIEGSKHATGDFICFVDSDDYIEKDYYRRLVFEQKETDADIVFSNICNEYSDAKTVPSGFSKYFMLPNYCDDYFEQYINSSGRIYRWHVIWDKLIRRSTWEESLKYLENIKERFMMCEDVVFSSTVLALSKKISIVDDIFYFYCDNKSSSISFKNLSYDKISSTINDIVTAFKITTSILEKIKGKRYDIKKWRDYYITIWINSSKNLSRSEYDKILDFVKSLDCNYKEYSPSMYDAQNFVNTSYDERSSKIIDAITEADVVSFDVFDTLILRPFFDPSDLFWLLDDYYIQLSDSNGVLKFSYIRKEAEAKCRRLRKTEVSLDDIYDTIHSYFDISKDILNKLKAREIELELRFCYAREYGKNLYQLAQYLGKKIIITSDMYLSKETIKKILSQNGYFGYDNIFVSSEYKITKSTGRLYDLILSEYEGSSIVHIDDSIQNCKNAEKKKIAGLYLPKALDCYLLFYKNVTKNGADTGIDARRYFETSGVRASIGVVANKIFDNPFFPREVGSTFNGSPFEVGYAALGPDLLSISNWLLSKSSERKLSNLCFFSRDGYLPLKATQKLLAKAKALDNNELSVRYVYTSRRVTMPLAMIGEGNFNSLITYIDWTASTPKTVLKLLADIIDNSKINEFYKNNTVDRDKVFINYDSFIDFILLVKKELYSPEKHEELVALAKDYYGALLDGNCGVFDIGYSAKPELLIGNLLNKRLTCFFIHSNSSEAYINSRNADNALETYYDYKPIITGVLRELLYSSISNSCIGYERMSDGNVSPIVGKKDTLDPYDKDVITLLQSGALSFIDDFLRFFGDYFDIFDFTRFYMSMPIEFFMNKSCDFDRLMFKNMTFDDNGYIDIKVTDFWKGEQKIYNAQHGYVDNLMFNIDTLPRRKRILFYTLFNKKMLKTKIIGKFNDMSDSPKLHRRAIYILLKDRSRITSKFKRH